MSGLTPKQLRAVEAIARADTISDAATACGVHRCTLHKWLTLPEFAAALEETQREARARAVRRLSAALDRAAQTVISLAETSEDEAIRLRAAIAVPAMLREVLEVEAAVMAAQTEARAMTIEYVNDWRKAPTVFDHDAVITSIASAAQPVE